MSRKLALLIFVVAIVLLVAPAAALGAGPAHPVGASILGSIGSGIGSVFSGIGHAVLGAFSWTIELASKFILTTIGALVKLLIPHSWVHKGLQIMQWIVAVPNYAGQLSTPGGGHHYGFQAINALRDLFMWLGIAVAPLTLIYATSRALIGESEPVGIPLLRMLAVAVLIVSYPYWWTQAAALADQLTNAILSLPAVTNGLYKLMDYAVTGVVLGGWQLVDLALMATIGLLLLGLIFLKVALILLGALLYATGPLMIGLVPTQAGSALARAWASAVAMIFGLGIAWATLFAVGSLLISDAGSAGPLIAGNSIIGSLLGGLLLVIAGAASLYLCLKAAKEAAGLLRMQLAGLLALSHRSHPASAGPAPRPATTGRSLRDYSSRLARAASAAGGELALAGSAGGALAASGRAGAYVGRRGILGSAAVGARAGSSRMLQPTAALLGRSRAGAVAVGMARAGSASWTRSQPHPQPGGQPPSPHTSTRPDRAAPVSYAPIPGRQPPTTSTPAGATRRGPYPGSHPAAGVDRTAGSGSPSGAGGRPRPRSATPNRPGVAPAASGSSPSQSGSPARPASPPPGALSPSRRPPASSPRPTSHPAGKPAAKPTPARPTPTSSPRRSKRSPKR